MEAKADGSGRETASFNRIVRIMRDHRKREIVSAVTEIAELYGNTEQLRDRIAHCILPAIDAEIFIEREECAALAEETASGRDAEAIADAIRARSNVESSGLSTLAAGTHG